ncbi:MAG: hypothetical protein ACOYL1_01090 [Chlamydiia bacterium]
MIPSGISLKQIPNYCHLTQRETWCDLSGSVDAVRQKSSIQLQAIALRSATLAKETSKASPRHPFVPAEVVPSHLLTLSLGIRCIALTPLRFTMTTLLSLIRQVDKTFQEYEKRNKGFLKPEGETQVRVLIDSLRRTPLMMWNILEANLMGYTSETENDMLGTVCEKIRENRENIARNMLFFDMIGCRDEITSFGKLISSLLGAFKTDAEAKKILPLLAFPLDGTLDRQLGESCPLDPFPVLRIKELESLESSMEYVASCMNRNRKLFDEVEEILTNLIKKEKNREKKQVLASAIADVENILSAYDEIKPNIDSFLTENTVKKLLSSSPTFFETGLQGTQELHKVVKVLESLSESIRGCFLDFSIYEAILGSIQNLIRVFPQFPERLCDDLITDVLFPFSYLQKLSQHLLLDYAQYSKKALESTERLLQSTSSKSSYLHLIDLWAANMIHPPSCIKMDQLKTLYNYLDQESRPLFGSLLDTSLQKTLKKLDPANIDFVYVTPYSRTLGLNFHHKFFHTPMGNILDLDLGAIQFLQKNLKGILEREDLKETLPVRILPDLQKLSQIQSPKEFLDLGKQFIEQHPLLICGSNNIVSLALQPLIRYVEFEALNDALRFSPSPSQTPLRKNKSFSPHSDTSTPTIMRRSPATSHRALQFDLSTEEEPLEALRCSPMTQSLMEAFHGLRLDPTVLHALEGLKDTSRIFKSPMLFYDEALNLFHNLLELILDPQGDKNHDLREMIPPSMPLQPKEKDLITLLEKDRQHRLTAKKIPDSIYPHHNSSPLLPDLEKGFRKHQETFFSLVLKCLKTLHKKNIDPTGLTLLEAPCTKTFTEKPLPSKFMHLIEVLKRLDQREIGKIDSETPHDTPIRIERFEQQSRKIEKSLLALGEIVQILNPEHTEMCDFSIAHQALYHLSLLTEAILIKLLLTKSLMSRLEANRHIVFEAPEGNRPIYNEHNTNRILEAVLLDTSISPEAKAQIATFRNFSNIVFRYLTHAQGHCHEDYLRLLLDLNLIAKDSETLHSGFTTADMRDLLKTEDISQSLERVHEIQKQAYKQILSTIENTFDALLELMDQHKI